MFFTNDVLVASGGKFATIWLAAMKKSSMKRKDYETVDLAKVCKELRRHLRPSADSRMTTIKGFSLRLSAQLVFGVSVVYHQKLIYLYKDASLSVQNLFRFQSQLQMYPKEPSDLPTTRAVQIDLPETLRNEDPMYGQLNILPESELIGDEFLTQLSLSNGISDESMLNSPKLEVMKRSFHSVHDIATITLQENYPTVPYFDESLLEGGDAENIQFFQELVLEGNDMPTILPEKEMFFSSETAAQNITTPASGFRTSVITPERPKKDRRKHNKNDDSDSLLAVPLLSDKDAPPKNIDEDRSTDVLHPPEADPSSDNSSQHTLDLVLGPIPSRPTTGISRIHPALIVDKKIKLDSGLMRNQLRTPINTLEEYEKEGNMIMPATLPPPKELFENLCMTYDHIAPSRHNVFSWYDSKRKNLLHGSHFSIPQLCFDEASNNIYQTPQSTLFSAHHAIDEVELLRPEDEYEELPNGPPLQNYFTESSAALADETMMTDASVPAVRDISKISIVPTGLGESMDSTVQLAVDAGMPPGIQKSYSSSGLDIQDLPFEIAVDSPDLTLDAPSRGDTVWRDIENAFQAANGDISFNQLATPRVTLKHAAVSVFFKLLMFGKAELLSLHQTKSFGEIRVLSRSGHRKV